MEESTLWVWCDSEKEEVFLGAGITFNPNEENAEDLGTDWIGETLSESFWENYMDFEPGIEKARKMVDKQPDMSYREALKQVFGSFEVSYRIDDIPIKLDWDIDYEDIIYDLIESC